LQFSCKWRRSICLHDRLGARRACPLRRNGRNETTRHFGKPFRGFAPFNLKPAAARRPATRRTRRSPFLPLAYRATLVHIVQQRNLVSEISSSSPTGRHPSAYLRMRSRRYAVSFRGRKQRINLEKATLDRGREIVNTHRTLDP
jgi:hypothetical protein